MKQLSGVGVFVFIVLFVFSFFCSGQENQFKEAEKDSITYSYVVANPFRAVMVLQKRIEETRKSKNIHEEARLLSFLGLAYYFTGKYDESAQSYLKAIRIYEELKDYHQLAYNYGEFGYQLKRRDLSRAENYMQMAIAISEQFIPDEELLRKLYNNYGVIKELKNEYDSAFYYYQMALQSKEKVKDSVGIPYSLNNIAGLMIKQKRFEEAKKFIGQSDRYRQKEENEFGRAENLALWGDLYFEKGQLDFAVYYYLKALQVAEQYHYAFLQEYSLRKLSESYEKARRWPQAFEFQKKYTEFKEKTDNENVKKIIAELEMAYDTERKNNLIAIKEMEVRRYRFWMILGVLSSVFLIAIAGLLFYIRHKRDEHEALLREVRLRESFINEKLKISRELHDNIGARLTYLISSADLIGEDLQNINKEKIDHLIRFSRETLGELRDTVWTIKTEEGNLDDLINKIRNYLQALHIPRERLNIEIKAPDQSRLKLTSMQMLNIFRIVQEAVQNSIKYAECNQLTIEFTENKEEWAVGITDNGKGFNVNSYIPGNGIENMQRRCEEIDGVFFIDSSPRGTVVRCLFQK